MPAGAIDFYRQPSPAPQPVNDEAPRLGAHDGVPLGLGHARPAEQVAKERLTRGADAGDYSFERLAEAATASPRTGLGRAEQLADRHDATLDGIGSQRVDVVAVASRDGDVDDRPRRRRTPEASDPFAFTGSIALMYDDEADRLEMEAVRHRDVYARLADPQPMENAGALVTEDRAGPAVGQGRTPSLALRQRAAVRNDDTGKGLLPPPGS